VPRRATPDTVGEDVRIPLPSGKDVSGRVSRPEAGRATGVAAVIAHGAGGDMHTSFLQTVAQGLAARGILTVRMNFPYVEARRSAPDRMPVLEETIRATIAFARAEGARTIVIGGKSMGGRAASHVAAAGDDIAGLVLLGYPLHPSGEPEKLRTEHLPRIRVPCLFVEGTRDTLCRLDLFFPAIAEMRTAVSLHVIEGGDHSFHTPARTGRGDDAVYAEIAEVTATWILLRPRASGA
jgi:predicted alpha/beta-hydrolase family hydrolase